MASPSASGLWIILVISVLLLQINPSLSLTCSTQKLTGNRLFDQCVDLPELTAYLHWTYDASNSSLQIAFVAPPAKTGGWVAWAINPTAPKMIGSQALIAYATDGKLNVTTFNITSTKIAPSKIDYAVSDTEAVSSGTTITIFATIALPAKTTKINQVWQVGSAVTNGIPDAHAMEKANLAAAGTLDLTKAASPTSPATPTTPSSAPSPSNSSNGVDSIFRNGNGISILSILTVFCYLLA